MWPSTSIPASMHSPPVPVTVSAMRAPRLASLRWCQYPISRNENRLVSSQNSAIWIRLPDSTTPTMEPMKARKNEKKRGTGSAADM